MSSASGLLALLQEPSTNDQIRFYALQNLNRVVHEFWFQISASIASVEALYEDEEFGQRELAAIVASKVWVAHWKPCLVGWAWGDVNITWICLSMHTRTHPL
jgi:hypothetical protein